MCLWIRELLHFRDFCSWIDKNTKRYRDTAHSSVVRKFVKNENYRSWVRESNPHRGAFWSDRNAKTEEQSKSASQPIQSNGAMEWAVALAKKDANCRSDVLWEIEDIIANVNAKQKLTSSFISPVWWRNDLIHFEISRKTKKFLPLPTSKQT